MLQSSASSDVSEAIFDLLAKRTAQMLQFRPDIQAKARDQLTGSSHQSFTIFKNEHPLPNAISLVKVCSKVSQIKREILNKWPLAGVLTLAMEHTNSIGLHILNLVLTLRNKLPSQQKTEKSSCIPRWDLVNVYVAPCLPSRSQILIFCMW